MWSDTLNPSVPEKLEILKECSAPAPYAPGQNIYKYKNKTVGITSKLYIYILCVKQMKKKCESTNSTQATVFLIDSLCIFGNKINIANKIILYLETK